MKAITLWQPWASLCVIPRQVPMSIDEVPGSALNDGAYACSSFTKPGPPFKTIETRSWKAPDSQIGQRIAIHAAKRPMRADEIVGQFEPITKTLLRNRSLISSLTPEDRLLAAVFPDDRYVYELPFGAVVGTAVLADCLPMVHATQPRDGHCLVVGVSGMTLHSDPLEAGTDVEGQRPFGHFKPGRWAWMLSEVERFDEPVPAVGRQGIWNWDSAS